VTGSLGGLLDGDPLTGNDIDADLDGPLVLGSDGSGLLLDVEDTVTIRNTDGETAPRMVVEVPAGLEDDRPTTVTLPLGDSDTAAGPLSGNDVDVSLGRLIGDGEPPAADEPEAADSGLSLPIDTGDTLSDAAGGDAVTGNTVDVHLGDVLGTHGSGTGSVIEVLVNETGSGTGSDNLLRVTLPIDLGGDLPAPGDDAGAGNGDSDGSVDGTEPGAGSGTGNTAGEGSSGDLGTRDCSTSHGTPASDGVGTDSGAAGSVDGDAIHGSDGGDPCGVGDAEALTTQSSSTDQPASAVAVTAGLVAMSVGLLAALGRRRSGGDPS
jgi:hypothetical protein